VLSAGSRIDPHLIFAEFELAPRRAVIAAVSGGSDSLALLMLLKDFCDASLPATRLVAVTVDHGLRPEAAGEARAVAVICSARGIAHRTLRWTASKPEHGLPAAAREARYRLLAEAAEAEKGDLVLTGHTLDDQVETVAMRKVRGDGRGLAGMAPATLYDGRVWIVRPLLGVSRSALRGYLAGRGIGWIDDPTNADRKYERARLRSIDAADRDTGHEKARSQIAAAAAERVALGEAASGLIRAQARLAAPGLVALDRAFAAAHDREAAVYALRVLLAAMGGTEQLPDLARSTALFERLGGENLRSTLSRAVVDARRAAIFIRRESRNLPQPSHPSSGAVWDGRFRVGGLAESVQLAPLGADDAKMMLLRDPPVPAAPETPNLVRAALATEPALQRDGGFAGLAANAGAARRIIAPWARFLPSFDLALARAAARLLGATLPPEPPFAGHNGRRG
jgi:tRNA(Ile)-lysidine synthase